MDFNTLESNDWQVTELFEKFEFGEAGRLYIASSGMISVTGISKCRKKL